MPRREGHGVAGPTVLEENEFVEGELGDAQTKNVQERERNHIFGQNALPDVVWWSGRTAAWSGTESGGVEGSIAAWRACLAESDSGGRLR